MRKTVILTFDDAVTSQYTSVAPLLKRLGFGATFFICRFNDEWRKQHSDHLLAVEQIRALDQMGFEIGNHTWNHPDLRKCDAAVIGRELDDLNAFLAEAGVAKPVSFAYPGGPFAANAVPQIRERGFLCARSTEHRTFNKKRDDWMNLPSFPIQGDDRRLFLDAVAKADGDEAVCILFHGVPDRVHPWVNTEFALFEEYMNYLKENDFRVVSLRDYLAE